MVDTVELQPGGVVLVRVALTTPSCPLRGQIKAEVTGRVGTLPGSVRRGRDERDGPGAKGRRDGAGALEGAGAGAAGPRCRPGRGCSPFPRARVAWASRRFRSTWPPASPLRGFTVGVLDADIAGFSVPRMLGVSGQLEAGLDPDDPGRKLIQPLVRASGRVSCGSCRWVSWPARTRPSCGGA